MDNAQNDLQALRAAVRDLLARVDRLERKLGIDEASVVSAAPAPLARPTLAARGALHLYPIAGDWTFWQTYLDIDHSLSPHR